MGRLKKRPDRETLERTYAECGTLGKTGLALDLDPHTVMKWMKEEGIPRHIGGRRPGTPNAERPNRETLLALCVELHTLARVALHLHVSPKRLRAWMLELKIPHNKRLGNTQSHPQAADHPWKRKWGRMGGHPYVPLVRKILQV